jgi:hypothetical protein
MHEDIDQDRCAPERLLARFRVAAWAMPLLLTAAVLALGCRTPKDKVSNLMASIVVTNRSSEQIETALNAVFKNHGYEPGRADGDELVFQKAGSVMSGVVYGDWYSGGVWERIKLYQRELDSRRTVVECDGYMVQEHEDPLFQKEKRQYGTQKSHLRKLLAEVERELEAEPAATAGPPKKPSAKP